MSQRFRVHADIPNGGSKYLGTGVMTLLHGEDGTPPQVLFDFEAAYPDVEDEIISANRLEFRRVTI